MKQLLFALLLALGLAAPASAQWLGNGQGCRSNCTFTGPITWATGLGAISQINGPTDQDLKISAGNTNTWRLVMGTNSAIALGTTAQNNNLIVNTNRVGAQIATTEVWDVFAGGMTLSSGSLPTVTTCGTGTVTAGSTNNGGEVTATGATSCTVNFTSSPFATVAFCTVSEETTAAAIRISAQSTSAFTVTGLTSGDKFTFHCFGK